MIKLKLNYRTYKIDRFTKDQWREIMALDLDEERNWPRVLGIATGQPWEKFHNTDQESLILGIGLVMNELGKRRECKIKDFTQLNLGEFVDLDVWISLGMEKHLDDILDMILLEPTNWIDEALWAIDQFANWRISTYRSYAGLFGINEKTGELVEPEEWNPQKIAKGWYKVLVDLADNDITKLDLITDQPLKKALNFMSLRKEMAIQENFNQLQQKRQHDLQRRNR